MAVNNPAMFLSNAGATHTAADLRTMFGALLAGLTGTSSFKSAGGVHPRFGDKLLVEETATPSMSVDVGSGFIFVPGTESTTQGVYGCFAPTTTNLGISAAHATLDRIDLVVGKIEDSVYSGATDAWSLVVVTGTPAASPVAPSLPSNSQSVAQVLVSAGATSITNSDITDTRIWMSTLGGELICTHATRPLSSDAYDGMRIYETDTGWHLIFDASTGFWASTQPLIVYKTAQEVRSNSSTYTNDSNLAFFAEMGSLYSVHLRGALDAAPAADWKQRFSIPGSGVFWAPTLTAQTDTAALVTCPGSVGESVIPTLGGATAMTFDGTLKTDLSTDGTVTFQWAQNVAQVSNFALREGTMLIVHKSNY